MASSFRVSKNLGRIVACLLLKLDPCDLVGFVHGDRSGGFLAPRRDLRMTTSPLQRNLSPGAEDPQSPPAGASLLPFGRSGTLPSAIAASKRGSRGARALVRLLEGTGVPCEVVLPSGDAIRCGEGSPKFRVTVHSDRALRGAFDERALGE